MYTPYAHDIRTRHRYQILVRETGNGFWYVCHGHYKLFSVKTAVCHLRLLASEVTLLPFRVLDHDNCFQTIYKKVNRQTE